MKKILLAAFLSFGVAGTALAAEESDCCKEKDGKLAACCEKAAKGEKMACCEKHQDKDKKAADGHEGHAEHQH